jgi:hypothetical protein
MDYNLIISAFIHVTWRNIHLLMCIFFAWSRVIWAGIFKPLWSPGIDAKASIPPAYVAWRASTITLFLLGAYPP